MAHGWSTKKTATGYEWSVTRTVWDDAAGRAFTTILQTGTAKTRARAAGAASRVCLQYRRAAA